MKGSVKSLIVLVVLASIVSAGSAFAAKNGVPGKPSANINAAGSSVSLRLLNGSSEAHIGDQATFDYTSSATYVWVSAKCQREGSTVYTETRGFFPEYPWGSTYTLGPTSVWTSGTASCKADLITTSGDRTIVLASTSFTVIG